MSIKRKVLVFTYYLSNRKYTKNTEANTTIFATTTQDVKALTGSTRKFLNSVFILICESRISRVQSTNPRHNRSRRKETCGAVFIG
jgi:hypothetical protein